ncbi:hypothetical protein SCHPADRAFT_946275 [Schizopora paradoxa]|uniref:Uncharacterized protein n=1 Tax=Schizopora paradoxa TaxID=27342 RepID=A0A0H2RN11_9AGAM|nr:hypothetical protein SCHPADRAFT_946275 [Schizopora paradoxa]
MSDQYALASRAQINANTNTWIGLSNQYANTVWKARGRDPYRNLIITNMLSELTTWIAAESGRKEIFRGNWEVTDEEITTPRNASEFVFYVKIHISEFGMSGGASPRAHVFQFEAYFAGNQFVSLPESEPKLVWSNSYRR